MHVVRLALLLLVAAGMPQVDAHGQTAVPEASRFVEADGARLFVRTVGSGTPIVVLHGGPGMSHDYLAPPLIELLGDRYRLIFYDQRASGRSTGVTDTARITMAQFVADLERLRRTLGLERLTLLGHSFGGLLAMSYAVAHPERVERLLLIDTSRTNFREAVARERRKGRS